MRKTENGLVSSQLVDLIHLDTLYDKSPYLSSVSSKVFHFCMVLRRSGYLFGRDDSFWFSDLSEGNYTSTSNQVEKWTSEGRSLEMLVFESSLISALVSALTSVLPALLLLALSRQLWTIRWTITRDKDCKLPLPEGSMGWPLVGETFHWLFQVRLPTSKEVTLQYVNWKHPSFLRFIFDYALF